MRIRYNEEIGTIDIDGVVISANVLRELVDPNRRLLFRFEKKNGVIQATAFSESQVIWLEQSDLEREAGEATLEFGVERNDSA